MLLWLALLTASCGREDTDDMVAVPGARFEMGCDPERDPSCAPEERPAHALRVAAFRIDRTEVTQADYARCVGAKRCPRPRGLDAKRHPRVPVTNVTWQEARTYCAWRGRRLPTEAEWELAARGTDGRVYPWGDDPPTCARAHTNDCGEGPRAVGDRRQGASPYGALDMAGNVDEWVEDPYRRYGAPTSAPSTERVARGGAYDAWHSRSSARSALHPDHRDALVGFRCARSP
jgi:iron(II)-dependent oxidoreductase